MIKNHAQTLEKGMTNHQPIGFKKSFLRALLTSITATSVDFCMSVVLKEWIGIYCVVASPLGGLSEDLTAFFTGRVLVSNKSPGRLSNPFLRFIFPHFFSIFLNPSVVFFIVEHVAIPFVWSRIVVACFVGFFFNFLMNRYFVFRS